MKKLVLSCVFALSFSAMASDFRHCLLTGDVVEVDQSNNVIVLVNDATGLRGSYTNCEELIGTEVTVTEVAADYSEGEPVFLEFLHSSGFTPGGVVTEETITIIE
jgi:hypothetical protein